jgi:hypothetical protein
VALEKPWSHLSTTRSYLEEGDLTGTIQVSTEESPSPIIIEWEKWISHCASFAEYYIFLKVN